MTFSFVQEKVSVGTQPFTLKSRRRRQTDGESKRSEQRAPSRTHCGPQGPAQPYDQMSWRYRFSRVHRTTVASASAGPSPPCAPTSSTTCQRRARSRWHHEPQQSKPPLEDDRTKPSKPPLRPSRPLPYGSKLPLEPEWQRTRASASLGAANFCCTAKSSQEPPSPTRPSVPAYDCPPRACLRESLW